MGAREQIELRSPMLRGPEERVHRDDAAVNASAFHGSGQSDGRLALPDPNIDHRLGARGACQALQGRVISVPTFWLAGGRGGLEALPDVVTIQRFHQVALGLRHPMPSSGYSDGS